MSFIPVLLICVVAALLFAAGAFFTAVKAGVTLEPGAEHESALVIGYKGFNMTAGNALVALIVCSLLCMTVVPVTLLWLNYKVEQAGQPVALHLNFTAAVPLQVTSTDDESGTHDVKLTIYKSTSAQGFQVTGPGYAYAPIIAGYDWANQKPYAVVEHQTADVVMVGSDALVIRPFDLPPETVAAKLTVPGTLSMPSPVPQNLAVKPDPPGLRLR